MPQEIHKDVVRYLCTVCGNEHVTDEAAKWCEGRTVSRGQIHGFTHPYDLSDRWKRGSVVYDQDSKDFGEVIGEDVIAHAIIPVIRWADGEVEHFNETISTDTMTIVVTAHRYGTIQLVNDEELEIIERGHAFLDGRKKKRSMAARKAWATRMKEADANKQVSVATPPATSGGRTKPL